MDTDKGHSPNGSDYRASHGAVPSPPKASIPNAVVSELPQILSQNLWMASPVGSRVTCDPAPVDTDEDWLVLVRSDPSESMANAGFKQDGSPQFYTGNDNGGFRSWRRGELNIVTTESAVFYKKFMAATELAKRFNLLRKSDRIALFQAVLYGVGAENLEWSERKWIKESGSAVSPDAPKDTNHDR